MGRNENHSQRVNLHISGPNKIKYTLPVRTVKQLSLPSQSINYKNLCNQYPHLKGLPINDFTNAEPSVLLGINNLKFCIPTRVKEGKNNEPIAIRTRLGWLLCGNSNIDQTKQIEYNFHTCECDCQNENKLNYLIKQFYSLEMAGITNTTSMIGKDDQKAIDLLEKHTKQISNGHYETALLWRYNNVKLPQSFDMAKKRLLCLEKSLKNNRELFDIFKKTITEYLNKGYITKVKQNYNDEKIDQNVWYLPIFPVFNKNKPNKTRIVWDAAAKSNGVSLNNFLLKGPDMLASLPSILFRFRQRKVAVCGDIEQMFHQIFIRKEDRNVQRFLWRSCDENKEPDVYIMNVLIFGASCAPCISQYVKNLNASKFENKYPEAAAAIKDNHYVDDFLASTDSIEEASKLAKDVRYIHSQAGFNIRNWCSNSNIVLQDLNSKKSTNNICLNISDGLDTEKIVLQEVWRSGVEWDEPILEEQHIKWKNWITFLPQLNKINIPRCYLQELPNYNNIDVQLHTFVDASENGYAAVSYFRIFNGNKVVVSLIGSKTRVAPLKVVSIPRLELMAAVIGARFANTIIQNHSVNINRKVFWSDSQTVLSWIRSDHRKYHQFVAVRISEILDNSEINEWLWISGKNNVADEATKWAKKPDISDSSRWINGPEFLKFPENKWQFKITNLLQTELELKQHSLLIQSEELFINVERFSRWCRVLRTTAFVIRFCNRLKTKQIAGNDAELTQDELFKAELILLKQAQQQTFCNEIKCIQQNKNLPKTSFLYKLSPFIDNTGVLRVAGRIENADIPEEFKHPAILPKYCRITKLLILHYHNIYHHINHETVVNEIRQRYYIPKLRVVCKLVVRQCQMCKVKNVLPVFPQMAKLPRARLGAFQSPFTFTGLDFFGPLYVTVNRHKEKRYGALFTCLTIRAVHIEIVHTLNTSSCIMAIRNFTARRGQPREFFSDNGTNFVGADRELQEAFKEVNKNELVRNFTNSITKWNFNPPSAPHMGGAWERLVRSVKTVLYKIKHERCPCDETLKSMMAEVETIINSRPLTYVPVESENGEAITPNHFLLGSSNGIKPLATYDDDGVVLRECWLRCQQYADIFWRRWVTEYLPTLTCRSKWFEKAKPLAIGELVVVVDPANPRNVWPKGRIIEVYKSADGQVRKAKVMTTSGILERPAAKLAVLNVAQQME
ncbi:uncharacterized protein LOC135958426 [Calliphora vicina]|uniref:uncharacterized protein LOC135958426 n=1 Tax=Calliphora vicina TaxID=7373 RepID=UPI00325B766F